MNPLHRLVYRLIGWWHARTWKGTDHLASGVRGRIAYWERRAILGRLTRLEDRADDIAGRVASIEAHQADARIQGRDADR